MELHLACYSYPNRAGNNIRFMEKIAMSEERQPRRNDIPMGGIFLVFIGVVLLLQSLGVLPWALWNTLWRFWPVLLITSGLSMLLRRYNVWLVSALIMVLLFGSLGLAIWRYEPSLHGLPGQLGSLYFIPV